MRNQTESENFFHGSVVLRQDAVVHYNTKCGTACYICSSITMPPRNVDHANQRRKALMTGWHLQVQRQPGWCVLCAVCELRNGARQRRSAIQRHCRVALTVTIPMSFPPSHSPIFSCSKLFLSHAWRDQVWLPSGSAIPAAAVLRCALRRSLHNSLSRSCKSRTRGHQRCTHVVRLPNARNRP